MLKTTDNIRSSYKYYKQDNQDPVDIKIYVDLCNNYNKFLSDKILQGEEVTLPERLGTMQIVGKKQKVKFDENGKPNLAPDWVKTKELWQNCEECKQEKKLVYHLNSNTDGVRFKLHWSKKNCIIKNKSLYSFQLTRTNKRNIHAKINEGIEYFIKN